MFQDKPAWIAHQRKRWLRPDWQRYMRPDWHRWLTPETAPWLPPEAWPQSRKQQPEEHTDDIDVAAHRRAIVELRAELAKLKFELKFRQLLRKAGFNPDQPRVPAGSRQGGRWTREGGRVGANVGQGTSEDGEWIDEGGGDDDPQILSDAEPDDLGKPGAQYAANRPRGSGTVRIGNDLVEVTPGQAARLAAAEARADEAIGRVREIDPNWRPAPSLYGSVEGLISAREAEAREAQARLDQLGRMGIGPGPFAGESMPARGPGRDYTTEERETGLRIFRESGCHTCGTFEAGTASGNPVLDHQPPTGLVPQGTPQRLYPQCLTCSLRQGGNVRHFQGLR